MPEDSLFDSKLCFPTLAGKRRVFMGKADETMYQYFQSKKHYADLMNAVLHQGRQVIKPEKLQPRPGRIQMLPVPNQKGEEPTVPTSIYRDIKMELPNGTGFLLFSLENQDVVDYEMPWRIMRYDCSEYGEQIRQIHLRKRADAAGDASDAGSVRASENVSVTSSKRNAWKERMDEHDRLHPVYTICFYHGTKKWTGPRRLSDMMDFGEDGEKWRELFCDYPMLLVCADDEGLADRCSTDLKWLLKALEARGDKERMRDLAKTEALRHLDPDTSRTIAVMTNMEKFLKNKEAYHNQEEEGDVYNMCQALEELAEEAREEGREEMREEMQKEMQHKIEEIKALRQTIDELKKQLS